MNKHIKLYILILVFGATFILTGSKASAATITVTANAVDTAVNGNCSLLEALASANNDSAVDNCVGGAVGLDTVNIPNGTYLLEADLDLGNTELVISGASRSGVIIDGNVNYGLIYGEGTAGHNLTIQHLTVTNSIGLNDDASGAEVNVTIEDTVWNNNISGLNQAPIQLNGDNSINGTDFTLTNSIISNNSGERTCGVAVDNKDTAFINNVVVSGNNCATASGDSRYAFMVNATSSLVATNVDVYDNTIDANQNLNGALLTAANIDASYIDVYNNTNFDFFYYPLDIEGSPGTVTLHHASIVNNISKAGLYTGNDANGFEVDFYNITIAENQIFYPALFFFSDENNPVSGTINNLTIANNIRAGDGGFAIPASLVFMSQSEIAPTATISNSLLVNNLSDGQPVNCAPIAMPVMFYPISNGNNLSDDDTCNSVLDHASDLNDVNALMEPLEEDNGTWVVPFQANSPANDGGATIAGISTDQRGMSRPQNDAFDIGAWESVLGTSTDDNNEAPDPGNDDNGNDLQGSGTGNTTDTSGGGNLSSTGQRVLSVPIVIVLLSTLYMLRRNLKPKFVKYVVRN